MKRIKIPQFLRLSENDVLTMVITDADFFEYKHGRTQRDLMMAEFRRAILENSAGTASMNAAEKERGSQRDASKEEVAKTAAEQQLFDRLCKTDEERNDDYADFEAPPDDDDLVSFVSSCVEGGGRDGADGIDKDADGPADVEEEPWENLNEDDRKEKIAETMKKLGNIKKKLSSPNILKDMLGADGKKVEKKIQAAHEKQLIKKKRKLDMIEIAVNHFEQKMKKRRTLLAENTTKSVKQQYERKSYSWRDAYKAEMKEIRKKRKR